jgi:predicted cupin superfamily sugar epimerase
MKTAQDIIKTLQLEPHPEGGYFRRTFKNNKGPAGPDGQNRGHASAIYFLQPAQFSRWHRTDGDELWFWHAGAPLTLEIRQEDGSIETKKLGLDFENNALPQHLAPANMWQRARSDGEWTLVSCSVSPGFLFETFEMETE